MKQRLTKKSSIFIAIFTTVILFAFSGSHPTTGSGGYTGAPNDNVCTTCHSPGGSMEGTIEISGLPAMVTPNATYPLTVTITDTSPGAAAVRAGFQMVSLKQNLANGGTFIIAPGETNAVVKTLSNSKSYVGHEPAKTFGSGDVLTFDVEWTAPASATGDITVYAASIIANGANGNSNDKFVATNVSTILDTGGTPLSATFSNVIDASCSDSNDGSATVNATGGSGGFTYNWDNGESNATAVMLTGGDHDVTITDASNAMITETVNIGSPPVINLSIITQTDATCNNTSTGTAEVSATGGTPGFTYNWGGGITGAIQNNLAAGIYNVTATDLNGCEETTIITIDQPQPLVINTINISEPSCTGDSNGSLTVEATGGNGGFTYNWLTSGIGVPNGGTLSSIPAGVYLVEVFDIEGCSNEIEITLGEPDIIELTLTFADVNCFGGDDGSASASSVGGTGAITYDWSNGESGSTAINLSAGTYFVTASDINGCQIIESVDISGPAEELIAGITSTNDPNCGNDDGTLSAFANGGTPDYTYLWNDGSTSAVLDNIPSGIYSITVTDENGCSSSTEITLTDNDGVSLAANDVTNNICNGASEGSATISASGGNGTYTYNWSNGGTNATESGLPAGTYSIIVTDENNCTGEIAIDITEPEEVIANETITNISCNAAEDGSITIAPSGGSGDLSFVWNTGSTSDTIEDLVPGLYSVVITDGNNCDKEIEFVIEEPTAIVETIISNTPLCPGASDGMIMVSATGGTGTLAYEWNDGSTGMELMNIAAGDYTLSITDENGCIVDLAFTLDDPQSISLSPSATQPTCYDSADGTLVATASGGTGSLSYLWENGSTDSVLVNISTGTYSVSITDENDCLFSQDLFLSAPAAIDPNLTATNESINGAGDGTVTADPQNGTAPYLYLWSNGDTTKMISGLIPGNYSVIITDSSGCIQEGTAIVNNGDCAITANPILNNISCFGLTDGSISIDLEGAVEPITYEWDNESSDEVLNDLTAGIYSVIITDANSCQIQITDLEITEPSEIMASDVTITNASNDTSSDGKIEVEFTGGTGDLSIEYTDGNGNPIDIASFNELLPGTYGVIITDDNGCSQTYGPYVVDVLSSINEESIKAVIYPIPAKDLLTIQVDKKLTTSPKMYTMNGQVLNIQSTNNNGTYQLDISRLNTGVYYIKLTSDDSSELKKIIVGK